MPHRAPQPRRLRRSATPRRRTRTRLLLTDRYPNSDPDALGPAWALPAHPVTLELDDDGRRSRLTVFFRFLLALPHFVWLTLWSVAAILAAFANWFVALVRGRSAEPLHRFLAAYVRYSAHVTAFLFLVANPFPGFAGAPGYPVDVAIRAARAAEPLDHALPAFLALPGASSLSGALSAAPCVVVGFLGWFAALATGRMPTGLRNLGAICDPLPRAGARVLVRRSPTRTRTRARRSGRRPQPEPEPAIEPLPEAAV